MKYQNVAAFEKHLQGAFPSHLSSIYMVVASCDFERKKILDKTVAFLRSKDSSSLISTYDATVDSIESILETLNTKSLFGERNFVIFDRIDKLKNTEQLVQYACRPNHDSFLVLGATALKPILDLYQKGKKEIVVLDLSEEKPWDHRRRLIEWLSNEVKLLGKVISSEVIAHLFEHIGLDMALLYQEVIKLACYVGDRPAIALSDAKSICATYSVATSWQLAEGVVWRQELLSSEKSSDLPFLLMFIGQLRYQFQVGYQVAELVESGKSSREIAETFPQLRPQTLEQYATFARQKKAVYFHNGLLALFQLELGVKSSSLDPSLLFDQFVARLRV